MITYAKSWFRAKKRVTEPWDEARARLAHERKETYVATVYRDEDLHCFLEIAKGSVCVGILDELKREYLTYTFQLFQPDKLFLSSARHRKFEGETDNVSYSTIFYFKQEGRVTVAEYDGRTKESSSKESAEKIDLSKNWEDYPEFGKYDSLIRLER